MTKHTTVLYYFTPYVYTVYEFIHSFSPVRDDEDIGIKDRLWVKC